MGGGGGGIGVCAAVGGRATGRAVGKRVGRMSGAVGNGNCGSTMGGISVGGKVGGAGVNVGRTVAAARVMTVVDATVGFGGLVCAIKSPVRQPSTISQKKLTRAIIRAVVERPKRVPLVTRYQVYPKGRNLVSR